MTEPLKENLIVVRTTEQLETLKEYIKDKEYTAVDTETTGLDPQTSEVIGFSVCAELDTAYYVVLAYWDVKSQTLVHTPLAPLAKDFLSLLEGKALIFHNAVFDCHMIEVRYGVSLMPSCHTDTMVLAHLLDENRAIGLKDLAVSVFGETSDQEQRDMKASVTANGGVLTKANYELYKADSELIAKYGAKDTILTLKLFYHLVPQLEDEGLFDFFYNDESMPLLRGPTYDLNTTGLKVDLDALKLLRRQLEADCLEGKAFIYKEIEAYVKDKYPATSKAKTFNIGAGKQLAWLLFIRLGEEFIGLTKEGREVCKALDMKLPYTYAARAQFIRTLNDHEGKVYKPSSLNPITGKKTNAKKFGPAHHYLRADKEALGKYADKYKWVSKLLEYSKNLKLLNTYVSAIEAKTQYGILKAEFKQCGTTSGRYASRNPNLQNLPRDDKRVKTCFVARPGNVFVGSDYSQLEPRVFASFSGDERLLNCFKSGDDFYSVVGAEVFGKTDCTLVKDDSPDSFAVKYKSLRQVAKVIALATPYGTTAPQMARTLGKSIDECQEIINDYFAAYPKVEALMLRAHEEAKTKGRTLNLFGRPRRLPEALKIPQRYGRKTPHSELPYDARNICNLAMNYPIQSTGASIMNRAGVSFCQMRAELAKSEPRWNKVKIVLQVHDELVLEGPEALEAEMITVLQSAMQDTVKLPGVDLIAEPKAAKNLADLK
jgi:DNA polymerase I